MTEKQIEFAAREFCKQIGLDPDAMIGGSPAVPPGHNYVPALLVYTPLWQTYAGEIRQRLAMDAAIALARESSP